jgi:DNA-binding transcriptional LysR family regulator
MAVGPSIDLLRALEIFLSVAETGSMTAASRLLHITQSAISQHMKLLESELGTVLADRQHRPLRLTPAGIALRPHAAELLLRVEQLRTEMRQIAASELPTLRIAMFATLARTLVPAILDAIPERRLPVTSVSLMRGMAFDQVRALVNRDVDIVIMSDPLYDTEGLERHELIHERFILALPPGLPRGAGLRDIAARLPLIRYTPRTQAARAIEHHLRRLRLDIPLTHSFDSPEDLLGMVARGRGWAITAPSHVVHALEVGSSIELRPLPKPGLGRTLTLVARSGELGELPALLAKLCLEALAAHYLPQVRALMPRLADHLTLAKAGRAHPQS